MYVWRQAITIFHNAANALNSPHTKPLFLRATKKRNTMIFVASGVCLCDRPQWYVPLFYNQKAGICAYSRPLGPRHQHGAGKVKSKPSNRSHLLLNSDNRICFSLCLILFAPVAERCRQSDGPREFLWDNRKPATLSAASRPRLNRDMRRLWVIEQ